MNILVISPDHPENPWFAGGQSERINKVFSRIGERHAVRVVTCGWPGGPAESRLNGLRYLHGPGWPGRLASRLAYCLEAQRQVSRGGYDILVEVINAFSPTFASHLCRRPAIVDFSVNPFEAAGKYRFAAPILRRRLRWDLRGFDRGVALCPSMLRSIEKYCSCTPDTAIVDKGVDREYFRYQPEDADYLLFLGRVDINHKGLDHLIEAYARVRKKHPEVSLVIAGTGPDEDDVRERIGQMRLGGSVEMVGWVEGEQKIEFLRKALMVCMPSRREGWPGVANEAAACGKPVVGFRVTGMKDAIIHRRTGLLVESERTDAFADAVCRLLDNPSMRRELGQNARERARGFTWGRTAAQYEAICEEVLS